MHDARLLHYTTMKPSLRSRGILPHATGTIDDKICIGDIAELFFHFPLQAAAEDFSPLVYTHFIRQILIFLRRFASRHTTPSIRRHILMISPQVFPRYNKAFLHAPDFIIATTSSHAVSLAMQACFTRYFRDDVQHAMPPPRLTSLYWARSRRASFNKASANYRGMRRCDLRFIGFINVRGRR